ncbi:hypothetical protein K493DRAFT_213461 [Basidiobolus meristosporus CBS 931.73]|uniref:Mitochondrial inner membrane protease ATP23 n=1 Tax=Basidiobolus meristosporus CBS 931.73 TaxID=1314790 RepID=A0A1Y1YLT0_9FUNG|nr:hypothetical protein K493DRAFT_213461 [Basidiobolus meristosporus CBS 931.73]|eukprot:ORX98969.1 hypothetical protein K493DRAFT_213461 [Basidiobolus meristosporus CBS 931.73]
MQEYETTELARIKQKQHKKCEKLKERLMKYSPMVTFMLENLRKEGVEFRKEHFICMECDESRCGGFSPDGFVALCQNRFISKKHMEDTMSHELIHAYDHSKYNVDWNNVYHVACTEVRAASLSGDCSWLMELRRGHFKFTKQHQACVKRRAILSLKSNPEFADVAEKAVGVVFESCFNDTKPFDEIY